MEDAILLVKDLVELVSQTEEKMLIYMFLIQCEFKNPIKCFFKKVTFLILLYAMVKMADM